MKSSPLVDLPGAALPDRAGAQLRVQARSDTSCCCQAESPLMSP